MKGLPWLRRDLTTCAYYYCLRLSEKDFHSELRRLKVPVHSWPRFLENNHKGATVHYLEHKSGRRLAIVCLDRKTAAKYSGIQIASMLVHEAVHIWQLHAAAIGSHNDHGDEEEAYAIQAITQELLTSFKEQMYDKRKKA